MAQPISGRPSIEGTSSRLKSAKPSSPTNFPEALSSTAQYPKPKRAQRPRYRNILDQASCLEKGRPPMNLVTSGSAHIAAQRGRSESLCSLNTRRWVSSRGTSTTGVCHGCLRIVNEILVLVRYQYRREFSSLASLLPLIFGYGLCKVVDPLGIKTHD